MTNSNTHLDAVGTSADSKQGKATLEVERPVRSAANAGNDDFWQHLKKLPIVDGKKIVNAGVGKQERYQWLLKMQCEAVGFPVPVHEHKFHPTRKWRFDFAWPEQKLALEVEGGVYIKTHRQGHSSVNGILRDIEKYNAATVLGWRVLRCLPEHLELESGIAIQLLEQVLR